MYRADGEDGDIELAQNQHAAYEAGETCIQWSTWAPQWNAMAVEAAAFLQTIHCLLAKASGSYSLLHYVAAVRVATQDVDAAVHTLACGFITQRRATRAHSRQVVVAIYARCVA